MLAGASEQWPLPVRPAPLRGDVWRPSFSDPGALRTHPHPSARAERRGGGNGGRWVWCAPGPVPVGPQGPLVTPVDEALPAGQEAPPGSVVDGGPSASDSHRDSGAGRKGLATNRSDRHEACPWIRKSF